MSENGPVPWVLIIYAAVGLILVASSGISGVGTYALLSDNETDNAGTISIVKKNSAGPTADAGGPYAVDEANSTELDGTNSTKRQGSLDYSWQIIDGNGTLIDNTTETPVYHAPSNVQSDITVTVELTVKDNSGSDSDTANITVRNVSTADAPSVTYLNVTKNTSNNLKFDVSADLSDPTGDGDQFKNVTMEFIRTNNDKVEHQHVNDTIGGDSATINYTSVELTNNKEYEIVVTVYDTRRDDSGTDSEVRTAG